VIYVFPGCRVLVDEAARYLETRFPDGTKVPAAPNTDPRSLAMADELGYGDDTWAMSRDHEITHTWLAHLDGTEISPVLWRLAHPQGPPPQPTPTEIAEEEARALTFQAKLDKQTPRPWDDADVPMKEPLLW
jgi:hypothetical protein